VLAGDNAIVIALAARNVPAHLRKKAIVWGTVGAIVVRSAMTVVVVWLLKIPGLMLIGGLALVWIAYKLLVETEDEDAHPSQAANSFWGAMKTIIIAGCRDGPRQRARRRGCGAWQLPARDTGAADQHSDRDLGAARSYSNGSTASRPSSTWAPACWHGPQSRWSPVNRC
jgi:hypothetical protein